MGHNFRPVTVVKNFFVGKQTLSGEQSIEDVFLQILASIIYPLQKSRPLHTGMISVSPSPPHKDVR